VNGRSAFHKVQVGCSGLHHPRWIRGTPLWRHSRNPSSDSLRLSAAVGCIYPARAHRTVDLACAPSAAGFGVPVRNQPPKLRARRAFLQVRRCLWLQRLWPDRRGKRCWDRATSGVVLSPALRVGHGGATAAFRCDARRRFCYAHRHRSKNSHFAVGFGACNRSRAASSRSIRSDSSSALPSLPLARRRRLQRRQFGHPRRLSSSSEQIRLPDSFRLSRIVAGTHRGVSVHGVWPMRGQRRQMSFHRDLAGVLGGALRGPRRPHWRAPLQVWQLIAARGV